MTRTFIHMLEKVSRNKKRRDKILKAASKKQLNAVRNVCYNLCDNKFNISEKCRSKLYPFRKHIRELAAKTKLKTSKALRRKIIQHGGFLPILLPAIISLLAEVGPAILGKALFK
jgi:superfamily I DNA/RNA helicase